MQTELMKFQLALAKNSHSILRRINKYTRINLATGCHNWIGAKHLGYGKLELTLAYKTSATVLVHRLQYYLSKPEAYNPDLHVLHKCDIRSCINPEHLYLGTNADNMTDCDTRGRRLKGEAHQNAILTEEQVKTIRELHATNKYTHKEIAIKFNMSRTHISYIISRKSWKHI